MKIQTDIYRAILFTGLALVKFLDVTQITKIHQVVSHVKTFFLDVKIIYLDAQYFKKGFTP